MIPTDNSDGFTLLELLAAILIIATLAVIALPNFRLASTRAKISRVRADLQTVTGALEVYRLDNAAYPPTNDLGTTPVLLSTPIAYLSHSAQPDPLFRPTRYNPPTAQNSYYRYNYFGAGTDTDPDSIFHYRWYGSYWNYSSPPYESGGRLIVDADINLTSLVPYDTTNGTISAGRIIRGQKQRW